MRSGRSFRFALVTGGKDPDDVLREQGAAALKAQLAQTQPFVEVLFGRERDLEPLDTPERRAGLKGRLRAAAAAIQDKDLASAYRDDLFARLDALFGRPEPQARGPMRGPVRGLTAAAIPSPRRIEDAPLTAEGRSQGHRLRHQIEPLPAALARAALAEPAWLDPQLEALEAHGFGDPALDELAKEIIRLRLNADRLDSEPLARHLASRGFGALLGEIDKAALKSGAPFLDPNGSHQLAKSQWTHAFEQVARMAALGVAIEAAKSDLAGRAGMEAIERMKIERDALRRAIGSGTVWADGGSIV